MLAPVTEFDVIDVGSAFNDYLSAHLFDASPQVLLLASPRVASLVEYIAILKGELVAQGPAEAEAEAIDTVIHLPMGPGGLFLVKNPCLGNCSRLMLHFSVIDARFLADGPNHCHRMVPDRVKELWPGVVHENVIVYAYYSITALRERSPESEVPSASETTRGAWLGLQKDNLRMFGS